VLWVGDGDPRPELERKRFGVTRITAVSLSRYEIEAAPMLIVLDPSNNVRYAGGYTERKQGPAISDLQIIADTQAAREVSALPVFGCAVSERLRSQLALLPTP